MLSQVENALAAHAGEIAHGVRMLRHWWPGKREACEAWLRHLETYAPKLEADVAALASRRESSPDTCDACAALNVSPCPHVVSRDDAPCKECDFLREDLRVERERLVERDQQAAELREAAEAVMVGLRPVKSIGKYVNPLYGSQIERLDGLLSVESTGDADDLCDHGCGDEATVQHADGRFLCYPCYRTETGGDNQRLPGCPTCSPAAVPAEAEAG